MTKKTLYTIGSNSIMQIKVSSCVVTLRKLMPCYIIFVGTGNNHNLGYIISRPKLLCKNYEKSWISRRNNPIKCNKDSTKNKLTKRNRKPCFCISIYREVQFFLKSFFCETVVEIKENATTFLMIIFKNFEYLNLCHVSSISVTCFRNQSVKWFT